MFSSWFHGRQQPPCSPPAARTTVTVRTEHVEVIGGGSQTSIDYSQLPLLPPELVIQIILAAADSILQDSVIPPQDKSRHLLRLASVNLECYKAILSHTLLKNLVLSGLSQTQAFQQSLDDDRLQVFRDIVGHRLTRLVVDHHQSSDTVSLKHQHALFDSVTRQQDFDKAVSIRPLLQHCHSLQELHLETTPRLLCEKRRFGSMDPNLSTWLEFSNDVIDLTKLKESLRGFSCVLGTWGGVGLEDIFVGVIKPSRGSSSTTTTSPRSSSSSPPLPGPILRQPWGNLTHLQIMGIAGFRVSMATASSVGSLPRLTHLSLCMPNVARDASSRPGDVVNTPPAAFQLLILLADRLEELILIGHTLQGFLGSSRSYGPWLGALRLRIPAGNPEEIKRRQGFRVKLITGMAGLMDRWEDIDQSVLPWRPSTEEGGEDDGFRYLPHPNHFSSWMMARTREGSHWQWDRKNGSDYRTPADKAFDVTWEVQEWTVPIEIIYVNECEGGDSSLGEVRAAGQTTAGGGRQSNTPQPATSPEEEVFGIDNLD